MDAHTFRTAVEDEYETELSRLGSSKALYAITEGDMEADAVLAAMADRATTAAETFEAWASTDDAGNETFAAVAETAAAQSESIAQLGEAIEPTATPTALDDYLRDLDDPVERAAGLAAWGLVGDRTLAQAVGFFVGSAERTAADRFRDLRAEADDDLDDALDLLETVCSDDDDWERAIDVAGGAVEAAYAHYVEVLEGMGIKVKPVC